MAIFDPNQDPTKLQDPTKIGMPPQSSIFASGMQSQAATAPQPTAIPGAQSKQLDKPMGWQVTDDQTVEGRINRIINAGSPLMQQAKSRSLEEANRRGLANTSMAVTAGESALYDAAMPIAQADASLFAKAAGYNADQTNQFAVRNVDAENQFGMQDKLNQQQKDMGAFDRETQVQLSNLGAQRDKDIALMNRETQVQLANLDAQNRAAADQVAAQNQRVLETNQQANSAYQQAVSAVSAIQNNPQMDAATKTQAIASIWRDLQTQMRIMESVAGLNLTAQLNFANYPGFDSSGRYVGFDANGNTAASLADAVASGATAPTAAGVTQPADSNLFAPGTPSSFNQNSFDPV